MFVAPATDAADIAAAPPVRRWVASGLARMTREPLRPVTSLPTGKLALDTTSTSVTPVWAVVVRVCVLQ